MLKSQSQHHLISGRGEGTTKVGDFHDSVASPWWPLQQPLPTTTINTISITSDNFPPRPGTSSWKLSNTQAYTRLVWPVCIKLKRVYHQTWNVYLLFSFEYRKQFVATSPEAPCGSVQHWCLTFHVNCWCSQISHLFLHDFSSSDPEVSLCEWSMSPLSIELNCPYLHCAIHPLFLLNHIYWRKASYQKFFLTHLFPVQHRGHC